MTRTTHLVIALLTIATACADLDSGRPEPPPLESGVSEASALPDDVLAAKRQQPADHGTVELPSNTRAELTRAVRVHLFSFTLAQPAQVSLRTVPSDGLREIDTVLSLSRVGPEADRRWVAQNDDLPGTLFSGLVLDLPAATYEVTVRGFSARTLGAFSLELGCAGDGGCSAPFVCPFGSQFSDLRSSEIIEIISEVWIRSAAELGDELQRAQVVEAVRQSSHTDVTSADQALQRVDQQEVRRMELVDRTSGRAYVVYEYGAGDNSYGAVFKQGSTALAASIHDGDFLGCAP